MDEARGLRERAEDRFDAFAGGAARHAGKSWTFGAAAVLILAWALTGPFFGFSDTWQLVVNTSTTIVTFLMVFLIQHTQNKDSRALQLKLNELIAATEGASNRIIEIETLTDRQLERLDERFRDLAHSSRKLGRHATSVDDDEFRT